MLTCQEIAAGDIVGASGVWVRGVGPIDVTYPSRESIESVILSGAKNLGERADSSLRSE